MRRVFVDSGGFFAMLVSQDASHAAATASFAQAESEHWSLFTTNMVVVETYALLLARTRAGRDVAIRFLDGLDRSSVRIERVTAEDEQRAIRLVRAHADKTYSLCDAISFVVMERLGIEEVIAYDRHFREYGRFRMA